VTDIVDGDTVDIRFANGTTDTVRLLGIDTPEVYGQNDPTEFEGIPDTEAGADCLGKAGEAASDAMERFRGVTVTIRVDPQSDTRGSYGRLLAYVEDDGENVNYQLVATGLARVYDTKFTHREAFDMAEHDARGEQRGLWACQRVTSTTTTTRSKSGTASLAVATVHADAAGNDHTNENDEYITFRNTGDQQLDISGWRISDAAGHTYVVPGGTRIPAGETITLYTGSGTDTSTRLYWGSDAAIWNNGGDTIIVETAGGRVVLKYSY